jgi:hypothetical protein
VRLLPYRYAIVACWISNTKWYLASIIQLEFGRGQIWLSAGLNEQESECILNGCLEELWWREVGGSCRMICHTLQLGIASEVRKTKPRKMISVRDLGEVRTTNMMVQVTKVLWTDQKRSGK